MTVTYSIHIAAGALGLVSGFIALYVTKGAALHRRAGMVFVYAMLTMSIFGTTIAAVRGVAPTINVPAGLLTAYLVITGLTTVRPLAAGSRRLDIGAALLALVVGLSCLTLGFGAVARGGKSSGFAFPLFMFGTVGLLASIGDLRMMRSGALQGAARLARHLWRMSFALFIAAMSFFIGQAKVFPKPIRIMPLLALPVLAVLVTMFYWLWRVRVRRSVRGIVAVGMPEPA